MSRRLLLSCGFALMLALQCGAQTSKNVVLIVTDGLRWQEVFNGADPTLLDSEHGGSWMSSEELHKRYWRADVEARRKALFPFLWGTVARDGQIFGNQAKSSVVQVSNGLAFSYPGYNEMITGHPDRRIDSNEFGANPNVNVFEWLNTLPAFRGHVAVYGTWQNFADIFNQKRSHLTMQVGWNPPPATGDKSKDELLRDLYASLTKLDEEDTYDALLQVPLLDFIKAAKPRVLFVGYGETDNWAHSGRYDLVLESAHQFDAFVQQLWQTMESMPEYRDQTTFIITTDHGRGSGLTEWKEHGVEQKGSDNIWIAFLGAGVGPLGERKNTGSLKQAQIAETIAQFLGQSFRSAVPEAAPSLLTDLNTR